MSIAAESGHVAQASLKLCLSLVRLLSAGITGVSHDALLSRWRGSLFAVICGVPSGPLR